MSDLSPQASTFTDDERVCLETRYRQARAILEYGAGESTRFAARLDVALRTVESDPAWVTRLGDTEAVAAATAVGRLDLRHADIGPVENWGYPDDTSRKHDWPDYVLLPWRERSEYDLVFVDGRFRLACLAAAALEARPGTIILVHDFWPRPHYHPALTFLDWVESADTLAVFTPRPGVDPAQVRALRDAAFSDPR